MLKLLEKKREDRYQSVAELRADLAIHLPEGVPNSSTQATQKLEAWPRRAWRRPGKVWKWGGLVALVGVAAVILTRVIPFELSPRAKPAFDSVAVLPIQNTDENIEDFEILAMAIPQTISNKLSDVGGVRVIPWVTTQRFRDSALSLQEIAR